MVGQYSVHVVQIHFEFQIFIAIVSIWFISLKIYQILLQLQLNLFSSIGKLHLLWCIDNIQSIFLQIHFEFQIFIDKVSISFISMKIYQILVQLQINLFSSIGNYIYCDVWTIFSPHFTKYTLNFKFSLILYLYHSSQWKSIRYYCSSASKFLVQIESWIYCDAWTIFKYTFYKYNLSLKFSLILYLNHSFQWRFFG